MRFFLKEKMRTSTVPHYSDTHTPAQGSRKFRIKARIIHKEIWGTI